MRRQEQGLWIGLGVLLLVVLLIPMLGGGMMGWSGVGPGMMGWSPANGSGWLWGFGMSLGMLVMFAFWAAIIVLAALAFRHLSTRDQPHATDSSESAAEILKRRYAAGEITREQFDEMRRVLEGAS